MAQTPAEGVDCWSVVRPTAPFVRVGEPSNLGVEILGCWNGRCSWSETTLTTVFREALPKEDTLTVEKGASVNTDTCVKTLKDGRVVTDESASRVDTDLQIHKAVLAAKEADVVIMAVDEPKGWTGENVSRAYLTLTGQQQALFAPWRPRGKPAVTIVFCGRPLSLVSK